MWSAQTTFFAKRSHHRSECGRHGYEGSLYDLGYVVATRGEAIADS